MTLNYKTGWPFQNGHFNTLYTSLARKVQQLDFTRERIDLADGDFLDLDWMKSGKSKLVILSHGLEGNSRGTYIQGMMKHFLDKDFDAVAWNCRGCSGEINRKAFYYNSGVSHDLSEVVDHITQSKNYDEIFLIGFSMGVI